MNVFLINQPSIKTEISKSQSIEKLTVRGCLTNQLQTKNITHNVQPTTSVVKRSVQTNQPATVRAYFTNQLQTKTITFNVYLTTRVIMRVVQTNQPPKTESSNPTEKTKSRGFSAKPQLPSNPQSRRWSCRPTQPKGQRPSNQSNSYFGSETFRFVFRSI